MTAESLATSATTAGRNASGAARRTVALGRAEALLLRRSPVALLNAVAAPVALVAMVRFSLPADLPVGMDIGSLIATSLIGFALLLPVYYNLVTVLVARREDLVLKRLRSGELMDAEILTGTAAPAIALAWIQSVVGLVAAVVVFDMAPPVNPVLVLVAVVLGTVLFVLLAAASTALTKNVEMAQVSTMPVLLPTVVLSGVFTPVELLPDVLQRIAQAMPLAPVVDLVRLGLTGVTTSGEVVGGWSSFLHAVPSVLLLVGWVAVAALATRRWLRWEPRREVAGTRCDR